MLATDKTEFSSIMINCFQNFRAAISTAMVNEWFEELKGFDYFHIRNAFRTYTNENEKYAPTRAAIINLAKKNANKLHYEKMNVDRCFVEPCKNKAEQTRGNLDEFGNIKNIRMCSFHDDAWILKMQPNSLAAKNILGARKSESEAKALGMTGFEYFKKLNPKGFDAVQKMITRKSECRENIFAVEEYLSGG